jgi:hypothetical protein
MTEWIEWNGGECPVHPKTVVHVQLRYERRDEIYGSTCVPASNWKWHHYGNIGDIIAYKVIKEHQPTIAETIREAAINWPVFLGDVECGILDAFAGDNWSHKPWFEEETQIQNRTFMLIVAEALE